MDDSRSNPPPDGEDFEEGPTPVTQGIRPLPEPLTHEQRVRRFGSFPYRPEPFPSNPERIVVLGTWFADNIVSVSLPFQGTQAKTAHVHKLIAPQFEGLLYAWRQAGLLKLILTWDGAYMARYKRGRARTADGRAAGDEELSNHAWGTAFDVNAPWNHLGTSGATLGQQGSTRQLIPLAQRFGFLCGAQFHPPHTDAMHFEAFKITTK